MMLGVDGGWCGITVEQMNLSLLNYVRGVSKQKPRHYDVRCGWSRGGGGGGGGGGFTVEQMNLSLLIDEQFLTFKKYPKSHSGSIF